MEAVHGEEHGRWVEERDREVSEGDRGGGRGEEREYGSMRMSECAIRICGEAALLLLAW